MLLALALFGVMGGVNADSYEILYGIPTYDTDGTTVIGVDAQGDFAGDANEATGVTFTDANGNAEALPIEGSALFANKKTGWTKNFSQPITEGKVCFSGIYSISANNAQVFKIVDSNGTAIFASSEQSSSNATLAVATICGQNITSYVRQPRTCAHGIKSLVIDLDTRKVTYSLIVSSGANKTTVLDGIIDLPSDVTDVVGLSVSKTNWGCYLDNVELYSQIGSEKKFEYTVNYQNGETIVSSTKGKAVNGEIVNFLSIVKDEDGNKYFIDDTNTSATVSSSTENVFTVNVRKAYTATLNLTTEIAGDKTVKTVNLEESDDKTCLWTYTYPIYILNAGMYYKADNTDVFGEVGTFKDGEIINKIISYSVPEPSVIFYSESKDGLIEDLKYSDGNKGYVAAQNKRDRGIAVGSIERGTYNFEVNLAASNKRSVVLRQSTNDPIAVVGTNDGVSGLKIASFTINEFTDNLWINGANSGDVKTNQSEDFDYVVIRKISDLAPISSAKFATYSPSSNVVVPEESTGIKVYTAKVEDAKINLTQVEAGKVLKAGTGYVVAGDENNYELTLSNDEAEDISDNDLKVAGENGVTATAATRYYVLAKRADGTVGFGLVADGVTIPAGKCYIDLTATGSKASFLSFGGETTAIGNIAIGNEDNGGYYTLQGMKTVSPAKGVYIHNGKKVVIK